MATDARLGGRGCLYHGTQEARREGETERMEQGIKYNRQILFSEACFLSLTPQVLSPTLPNSVTSWEPRLEHMSL